MDQILITDTSTQCWVLCNNSRCCFISTWSLISNHHRALWWLHVYNYLYFENINLNLFLIKLIANDSHDITYRIPAVNKTFTNFRWSVVSLAKSAINNGLAHNYGVPWRRWRCALCWILFATCCRIQFCNVYHSCIEHSNSMLMNIINHRCKLFNEYN